MKNTVQKNQMNEKLEKSKSGIFGFDDITFGGLPKSRPTLIVGGIGSGKTFMSMLFILNGISDFKENGVFMTFEERSDELITNFSNLKYDITDYLEKKNLYFEHLHIGQYELHESGKYNIEGLFVRIEHAIKLTNAKRIVLDSLDTLFSNLDISLLRSEFKRLFSWLKEKNITAIITAEVGDIYLTRLGLEENVADCVIELSNRITNQISTRRLRILKYRGSYHANNEYPFILDMNGIYIFPLATQSYNFEITTDRISSGISKLDEMLENKGFYLGSSILISGSAGTGKTSIAATFSRSICKVNKICLYCAFEEAPNQILRNMKSIGIDLEKYTKDKLLHFYYARPSLQNLELHFMGIKEMINQINPSVIILDPITNLMTEGPSSDIRSMLTRFIDFLKTKKITVMFNAAITIGTIATNPSDEGISSMVDTWLMLEDTKVNNKRASSFYVMKSRGMNHSKNEMIFLLNENGVELLEKNAIQNNKVIKENKSSHSIAEI